MSIFTLYFVQRINAALTGATLTNMCRGLRLNISGLHVFLIGAIYITGADVNVCTASALARGRSTQQIHLPNTPPYVLSRLFTAKAECIEINRQ